MTNAPTRAALDIAAEALRDENLTAAHNVAQLAVARIEEGLSWERTIDFIEVESEWTDNAGGPPSPRWTLTLDLPAGKETVSDLMESLSQLLAELRVAKHLGS